MGHSAQCRACWAYDTQAVEVGESMTARILHTDNDRAGLIRFIMAHAMPMTVIVVKGAKRSTAQNSTAAMWYKQISDALGDKVKEVKGRCKLEFGLPIMQRDRPDWIEEYSPHYDDLMASPLTYELLVLRMSFIPMTSLFTTKQMAEYMDAIQREYLGMGVALIDPEARKWANNPYERKE